jgi:uncharacterized protein (TIRG00374 family)
VSAFLAYLAVRGVDWREVLTILQHARYEFLVAAGVGVLGTLALRAWRWGVILRPVRRVSPWPLCAITAVGFLAVSVIPFRIGELVRPALLADRERIPFSSGLASIAVERCLDGLAFAVLVAVVARWLPLPIWARPLGYGLGGVYLIALVVLGWAWLARERCVLVIARAAGRVLPSRSEAIAKAARGFFLGLGVLPEGGNLTMALLLSGGLWLIGAVINYVSFFALGLDLPFVAAASLEVLITIGVLLPAAPGAVGSFHFFAVMGLRSFGVSEAVSLSYAILVHATLMVVFTLAGVTCGVTYRVGRWRRLEALVVDRQ